MSATELVNRYIHEAQEKRLWGMLQIDFQDGEITLIRREETTKIKTRKGSNREWPQPN